MLGSGRVADHRHDRLSGHIDVGSGRIGHSFSVVGDYNPYSRVTPDYAHEIQANSSLSGFPEVSFALPQSLGLTARLDYSANGLMGNHGSTGFV